MDMEFNAMSQYDANSHFSSSSTPQQLNGQESIMQQTSSSVTPELAYSDVYSSALTANQTQSSTMYNSPTSVQSYPTWTPTALQTSTPRIKRTATDPGNNTSHPLEQAVHILRVQTNFMPPPSLDTTSWVRKPIQEVDFSFEHENNNLSQDFGQDDDTPIIDLRQIGGLSQEPAPPVSVPDSRRPSEMSDSTFSLASSGRLVDPANFEDIGKAEVKFTTEIDWTRPLDPSRKRARISPHESPRLVHPERVRNGSISSPARFNVRSSPYAVSQSDRRNRWSTGSVTLSTPPPTTAPQSNKFSSGAFGCSPLNPHNALASVSNEHGITTFAAPGQSLSYTGNRPITLHEAQIWARNPWAAHQLSSQFPTVTSQSDAGEIPVDGITEPPNIYESLDGEEAPPPEEDMNPDDEDMIPRQEDPQSITDLYKPRWVRGKGHDREGWCGRCEGGCWAKLKNSGFWYHRSYTHGISPNTGRPYPPPRNWRLSEGNPSRWEGLCEQCGEWVKVDTTKKGHNSWFRHVVKCHPKNKCNKKDNGGIHKRRRTLSRHTLPHLRFHSPFGEEEDRSVTEDTEQITNTAFHEESLVQEDSLDGSHHNGLERDTMTMNTTTPPQPEANNGGMKLEEQHAMFHTPINHQHLLATPMSTPQLSSTPHFDVTSTPQIDTPAPSHGSMLSLHGLGLHNLMMPFSMNVGMGMVGEQRTFTNDTVSSSTTTSALAPTTTDDVFTDFTTVSSGETLHQSVSNTTAGLDTNSTSSSLDHQTQQQLLRSAYQTPQIIQGFSGLSVAYDGTPVLPANMNLASITSAPSGVESKRMSGVDHSDNTDSLVQFGSPFSGNTFSGLSHADGTPDWM